MKANKVRKFITILAAFMIINLILSACASPTPQAGETQPPEASSSDEVREITVLYLDDPPFWKEQAQRFTDSTGIKVNWEGIPFGQLHDKILTGFAAGTSPWDIIHVRDDWVAEFGSRGFLLSLNDRLNADVIGRSPEQAWKNLSWDGVNYGVPRYFWLWQFYYNQELLAAAGFTEAPKTWDEAATMAAAMTKDSDGDGTIDQWGFCEPWGENFASYPFLIHLRAAGGELLDDSGMPLFNSEAGVEALTWMVEMAKTKNYCTSAYELVQTGNMAELFAQGNIGMMGGTTQTLRLASDPEKSRIVDKVGVALMPGDAVNSATFSETGGLAIPATSKNADLAWEYIKFVTSNDEEKRMALTLSSIPAVTEVLNDAEVLAQYPHFQYAAEQMQYPFGIIRHPRATEVNSIIARYVIAALNGIETPKDALEKAYQEVLSLTQ